MGQDPGVCLCTAQTGGALSQPLVCLELLIQVVALRGSQGRLVGALIRYGEGYCGYSKMVLGGTGLYRYFGGSPPLCGGDTTTSTLGYLAYCCSLVLFLCPVLCC